MIRTPCIAVPVVLALAATSVPALPSDPVMAREQITAGIVVNLAMSSLAGKEALAGYPLQTASDIDAFCKAGGMDQLRRDRNRIQLRVNRRAAEQAGLRFSLQQRKVAEFVEGGD